MLCLLAWQRAGPLWARGCRSLHVASREGRGNKEIPRPASLAIGAFPGGV
jgi:hypothetical protein